MDVKLSYYEMNTLSNQAYAQEFADTENDMMNSAQKDGVSEI